MADPGNIACKEPYPVHCNLYCENIIELWESCKNNTDDIHLLAIIGSANREIFLVEHKYHLSILGQREYIKSMYLMNDMQEQLESKCCLRKLRIQILMVYNGSRVSKKISPVSGKSYLENVTELYELCTNTMNNIQITMELKGDSKRTRLQSMLAIIGSAYRETLLVDRKYHPFMPGQRKIIKSMYLMNYIQKAVEPKCSLRNIIRRSQIRMADPVTSHARSPIQCIVTSIVRT